MKFRSDAQRRAVMAKLARSGNTYFHGRTQLRLYDDTGSLNSVSDFSSKKSALNYVKKLDKIAQIKSKKLDTSKPLLPQARKYGASYAIKMFAGE